MLPWLLLLSSTTLACGTAYADRAHPRHRQPIIQNIEESPYQVDLIGENGYSLETYQQRGRYYVLGNAGDRYTIRVSNPTSRRVEAVVSVDGLDVIDGRPADLDKRGYVIPAYGQVSIEGFRVSTQEVATFRFSSVNNSYAGRKGKARNVGVIGVAIFEEYVEPDVVLADPVRPYPAPKKAPDLPYDDGDDDYYDIEIEASGGTRAPAADKASNAPGNAQRDEEAPAPRAPTTGSVGGAPRMNKDGGYGRGDAAAESRSEAYRGRRCCAPEPKQRPGLGTEFGERRGSAASWTRFVRVNAKVPSAMAELRYNDMAGLRALGIRFDTVDEDEIMTRETANPFPGRPFAEEPPSY